MKFDLDSCDFELACPSCGNKFKQKLGRLRSQRAATYPACGAVIDVNFKSGSAVNQVNDAAEAVQREIKKASKKPD